jgi:hypothetical protein
MDDPGGNGMPAFYLIHHNPFQKGGEGAETSSPITDKLMFRYPPSIPDRLVAPFFSAILSLYTYTTLSLNCPTLDYLSWADSHIGIRSYKIADHDHILFVLRLSSAFSELTVHQTLDFVKNGVFFILGPTPTFEAILKYITSQGPRLCSLFLSAAVKPPIRLALPHVRQLDRERSAIMAALTSVSTLRAHPGILGICCRVGGRLLISHTPIDIVRYFDFSVPRSFSTPVFLSETMQTVLDTDCGDAVLHQIVGGDVVFFVLSRTACSIEAALSGLLQAARRVCGSIDDPPPAPLPENTLLYDAKLRVVRVEEIRPSAAMLAIAAHDGFLANARWREVILQTPEEFCYARRMVSVEAYAFVACAGATFVELHRQATGMNPELERFLRVFQWLPPSVL